jgi:uncharacterized protein
MSSSTAERARSARSGATASSSSEARLSGAGWAALTALVCLAVPGGRTPKLAAIGTVAGVFSGLFGVGGGIVIVPLLILWFSFDERRATGTSLAAIVIIAAVGAGIQALYGNVHVLDGILVGIPALAGVVGGTWLQQRVPLEAISLLFAALLIAVAVELVVG